MTSADSQQRNFIPFIYNNNNNNNNNDMKTLKLNKENALVLIVNEDDRLEVLWKIVMIGG